MILAPTDDAIARAAEALRAGGLVCFPTETVYGLGASALSAEAVGAVFLRKGRPATNPLIVHVDGVEMARDVVAEWPRRAEALAGRFWPGPLTLVLAKGPGIPAAVTAGGATVAVRAPDHPVALALIRAFGGPLVAPSANLSGAVSPTTAEHVEADFADLLILDGGPCRAGIESTVVDLTGREARVLRQGVVTPEQIGAALGEPVAVGGGGAGGGGAARSPGLGAHYAPRAPLRLVAPEEEAPEGVARVRLPQSAVEAAARLYAALREADAEQPAAIWVEAPTPEQLAGPEGSLWRAILDRLQRAARGTDLP
jgi:L-threonylcarbamoyladenylate synthase